MCNYYDIKVSFNISIIVVALLYNLFCFIWEHLLMSHHVTHNFTGRYKEVGKQLSIISIE